MTRPIHNFAHGNDTAGYYRRKHNARRQVLTEEADPAIVAIIRSGVNYYGEELRKLNSLDDSSPEKLRASLVFHMFKEARASLSGESNKAVVQDLISDMSKSGIDDPFSISLSEKLQAAIDAIPDEQPEEVEAEPNLLGGEGEGDETDIVQGLESEPDDSIDDETAGDSIGGDGGGDGDQAEPPESGDDPEISPSEFGDLVDKLKQ